MIVLHSPEPIQVTTEALRRFRVTSTTLVTITATCVHTESAEGFEPMQKNKFTSTLFLADIRLFLNSSILISKEGRSNSIRVVASKGCPEVGLCVRIWCGGEHLVERKEHWGVWVHSGRFRGQCYD